MKWGPMFVAVLLIGGVSAAGAQPVAVDAELFEAVQAHSIPIERAEDDTLSGPGWERLMEEAEAAQFFLIAEQHATADIAQVSAAIHRGLAERDYDYMAVEIGPWSTRYAEQAIRETGDAIEVTRTAPGGGYALPFMFFAEDAELLEQVVALSPAQSETLWGLDQEFIAAAPLLLPMLGEMARTDAQRAAVDALAEPAAANMMFLGAAEPETYADLHTAFDTSEDGEALALVDAIILSNEVYGAFVRRSGPIYTANLLRENYMKDNFLNHFARIEERDGEAPKVFFKFGANHLMRGLSGTNVPSLGDFLVEWGRARDFESVNIMIDCLGGEAADILSGSVQPCESYYLEEDSLIGAAVEGQSLTLINLRALRPLIRQDSVIDKGSRDLIFGFDYYLSIADPEPATLVPPPMQTPQ